MIYPVILAGGSGTRLWPMSRELYPKQFLKLNGTSTLLQQTVERLEGLELEEPLLICNEEHRFIAAEQMRQSGHLGHNIILEPVGRNTAPAIALAAMTAAKKNPDAIILVLAADHVVKSTPAFQQAVRNALPLAEQGALVTFGIVPQGPETGYGYIQRGDKKGEKAFQVAQFVEKPNLELAKQYVADGGYYWNSGMFVFKAARYLDELKRLRPDIHAACERAMAEVGADLDFIRVNEQEFSACPAESVDYAVMELTDSAVVVPMDAGWSDVGSWTALWEVADKDEAGNANQGDVISHNSQDNLIFAENALVTTVGVKDLVIVQTKDAVLVADKNDVQSVKDIVQLIRGNARSEHKLHREVYRPWGKYDSIDNGQRYQVKRITVKPGEKLSVQMHHHRAEHWIVVSGTAKVTIGETTQLLTEDQSVYIPLGHIHALENPGKIPLELIEVQSGSYLGEDDIVRFKDVYGRV
ncbi:mannose-1-phosphate guanylyltransferase/mannose-6-phosphate isomerase [Marinimicrobium alkaliphilum]|uniref:mannose-1-phosphate guanylyltransferase/mannose-6-phosphate isomerase n=1 Tax=Marinimicrobium alkaliphilum TaxID=2202654 RepID=UPI0022B78472|nr:mannose-1-phosphate guanylyltransferase/mannose-6-phosphate isomerase [Marinimicrobium alkaliphilum]